MDLPQAIFLKRCASGDWPRVRSCGYNPRYRTEPIIGENLPALVWFGGIRERSAADIVLHIVAAIGKHNHLGLAAIFLGGCHVPRRRRKYSGGPISIWTSDGIFQKYLPSKSAIIPSGMNCLYCCQFCMVILVPTGIVQCALSLSCASACVIRDNRIKTLQRTSRRAFLTSINLPQHVAAVATMESVCEFYTIGNPSLQAGLAQVGDNAL